MLLSSCTGSGDVVVGQNPSGTPAPTRVASSVSAESNAGPSRSLLEADSPSDWNEYKNDVLRFRYPPGATVSTFDADPNSLRISGGLDPMHNVYMEIKWMPEDPAYQPPPGSALSDWLFGRMPSDAALFRVGPTREISGFKATTFLFKDAKGGSSVAGYYLDSGSTKFLIEPSFDSSSSEKEQNYMLDTIRIYKK